MILAISGYENCPAPNAWSQLNDDLHRSYALGQVSRSSAGNSPDDRGKRDRQPV